MSSPKDPLSGVVNRLTDAKVMGVPDPRGDAGKTAAQITEERSIEERLLNLERELMIQELQADHNLVYPLIKMMTRAIVQLLKASGKTEVLIPVADLKLDDTTQEARLFMVPGHNEDHIDIEPIPVE